MVTLPDGRRVRGRSLRSSAGQPSELPELGIYLTLRRPAVGWDWRWVRWPDFGLPTSTADAVTAIREAHARSGSARVEIACGAGVGRTGAALALLACLAGVPAEESVAWVRTHYHPHAAETPWQRRWVVRTAHRLLDT